MRPTVKFVSKKTFANERRSILWNVELTSDTIPETSVELGNRDFEDRDRRRLKLMMGNCSRSQDRGIDGETPSGQWLKSCSIPTTTPNAVTSAVHDRIASHSRSRQLRPMARSGDDPCRSGIGNVEALRCPTDEMLPSEHADQSRRQRRRSLLRTRGTHRDSGGTPLIDHFPPGVKHSPHAGHSVRSKSGFILFRWQA